MKKKLRKCLVSLCLMSSFTLAGGTANAQSASFPDFIVNETIAGGTFTAINADKITANYTDVITFNSTAGTFTLSRVLQVGQFVANDGTTPVASNLGPTGGTAAQYGLYALYQVSGTFTQSGGVTSFNLTPSTSDSLRLFLDPDANTTFSAPATGTSAWATGNSGDDILIATGVPTTGQGTLDPTLSTCASGISCGSFASTSSFALIAAGAQYFASPSPFFATALLSGQMNDFIPMGTQTVNGTLDMAFVGAVTQPPPQIISFAAFTPSLQVTYTQNGALFNFNGAVTLGATGTAFDPSNNAVSLEIAGVTLTIPAGSFLPNSTGGFTYSGTINGVAVNATIQLQRDRSYRVLISGSRAVLPDLTNPVSVVLRIGQNAGPASITATLAGRRTR